MRLPARLAFFWICLAPLLANAADVSGPARAIDGNSIEIGPLRLRLYGIDAPETAQSCVKDRMRYRCGQAAARALAAFIADRPVACDHLEILDAGWSTARCHVGAESVERHMVRAGWALAIRELGLDFLADEDLARLAGIGLWAGEFLPPWEWRRLSRLP